ESIQAFPQIIEIHLCASISLLRLDYFSRKLCNSDAMPKHAFQMVDVKLPCIVDCLAVSIKPLPPCDEVAHLPLRQPYSFPAVLLQQRSLPQGFGFGICTGLEKLAAPAECAKIDKKLVLGMVTIWTSCNCGLFHTQSSRIRSLSCQQLVVGSCTF